MFYKICFENYNCRKTAIHLKITLVKSFNCFVQYVIGGDAENGKSIKQLYGSQRKMEDQKVRTNKND